MDKALTNRVIILSFDCLSALDFPILQKITSLPISNQKGYGCRKSRAHLSFCNLSKSLNNRNW